MGASPHTAAGSPLLEREAELELLERAVAEVEAVDGRVVAIEGGGGIGNTRLLAAARRHAEAEGFEVLTARGSELEQGFAFGIVRQLFEPVVASASAAERAQLLAGAAGLAAQLVDPHAVSDAAGGGSDPSYEGARGQVIVDTSGSDSREPFVIELVR